MRTIIGLFLVFSVQNSSQAQPAYGLISFNINLPLPGQEKIHIQTIKRHLELIQKYNLKADYYFTWPAIKQITSEDPLIIKNIKKTGFDIHHHGANRPPRPELIKRIKGNSWEEDTRIVYEYETHDIDLRSGELKPSPGGLSVMKKWLAPDFFATGRFFQASILYVCKKLGAKMCVGLKENTGASRNDAWFMGILNRPETITVGFRIYGEDRGEETVMRLKRTLQERDTSKPFFFAVVIHDHDFFKKDRKLLSDEAQEKIWQEYEKMLAFLSQELQVINLRDVYQMAMDDRVRKITRDQLFKIAEIIASHQDLPEFIDLGDDYFSLTDAFTGLLEALTFYAKNNILPQNIETKDILGPTRNFAGITINKTIKVHDILNSIQEIPLKEAIPAEILVGGLKLNSAEFMLAMAKTILSLKKGKIADIEINSIELLPPKITMNQKADKPTQLQFWTYKPARWK